MVAQQTAGLPTVARQMAVLQMAVLQMAAHQGKILMNLKKHLQKLTELHSPSGHEGNVRSYLRDAWAKLVDDLQVSALGNLIGVKYGTGKKPRRRIMLCAHMDEIAMIVAEVRDGYVRLNDLVGSDGRIMQAKSVIVHGKRPLTGVVAAVPPHISNTTGDGKKVYPELSDQWVDLGLPAEEVMELVSVGDLVTMDAPLLELKNGFVAGKAMDNRASVAAVSYCLELLQKRTHWWDIYAVASVQEEVGYYGAITAAHAINPDLAITLDVTFAKQPGVNDDFTQELGKGAVICVGPNFHQRFVDEVLTLSKQIEIPLHVEPLPGKSGTDAWAIQVAQQGIPTILLSIPIRNMHTPVETVSLKDIKRTGRLIAELISQLDDEFLEKLRWQREKKESSEDENDDDE
ncbi:MAG: M42 family metallopeptidase [Anaerolineae bacterium]|nr:MAG: M42 family metallopeptidase [Anaerolineae bacterium]